jgi:hypothetical protein
VDNRKILRNMMFEAVSDVLDFLNKEWTEYGRKDYGDVFRACSEQCRNISVRLKKVKEEFEIENDDPLTAIQEHIDFVKQTVSKT